MKKTTKILFAILLVAIIVVSLVACKDPCADGHDWDNGVITTPADCERAGVMTYTCAICDETKEEPIPASHQLGDWIAETATELGHYHCEKCGKNFDADKQELTDITITPDPTPDTTVTLYWHSDVVLPEYVSMYFCGGVNDWTVLEAQHEAGADIYYVVVTLDKSLDNWDKYVIALGYNAASGLDEYDIDWKYKSSETNAADGTFTIADDAKSADLGTHTFSSMPPAPVDDPIDDPVPSKVTATFVVTFDAAMPEGYNVYLAGEMTDWGTNPQQMAASDDGLTYSVTMTLASGTYKFKVVACKGAFSWTDADRVEYGGSADSDGNAEVIVLATGGMVRLFATAQKAPSVSKPIDPTPSGSVQVTFTVTFDSIVPDGYNIYLIGEMTNNWDPTQVKTLSTTDGLNYSVTMKLASGTYLYKVVACKGPFSWDDQSRVEYGGSADENGNAQVTVPSTGGTIRLFSYDQKAPGSSSIPTDGSQYIIVGAGFSWDETTTDSAQYLTYVSGSLYTIDMIFSRNDTFKIKPNVSGWDGSIDGNATISVTYASGVTQVAGLFAKASSYDNIAVKYACSVTITVDVAAKTLDIFVKSVDVVDASDDEYIITGSMTGWVTDTTDSKYIFTNKGNGVYTITLTFAAGDIFKIKVNENKWGIEYTWHNENCQGGAVNYFQEGAENGNMMCNTACTVTITLNTKTGVITFERA